MADIARHSSERERLAVEAERESVRIAQAEYMRRFVGDEFDAIISGVTSYGLYVELVDSLAEGLVHVRAMGDDYYDFDSSAKQLVGRRKRRRYRLGDMVRVRLIRADVAERQLDFILVE
jgi:ribonuclease R